LFVVWVIFHILVCIALVLVVLLQSSKGEGLAGSAFGGSGGGGLSGAVFGGRGAASFLSRATTALAVVFMLNCGALAFMSTTSTRGGTATTETTGSSAVTRQAQREMEENMRRQQQQQQQAPAPGETLGGIQLVPTEQPTSPPAGDEPSGGN